LTTASLLFEVKYQLLDREHAPFGLTLFAQPRWTRIDEAGGSVPTSSARSSPSRSTRRSCRIACSARSI
jgi:hypothetical protein